MTTLLTQQWNSPLGPMILAASDLGLCGVWFEGQRHGPSDERLRGWTSVTAHPLLQDACAQLQAYFAGDLSRFDLPLDLSVGTAFQQSVWQALLGVPSGHSQSYGDLARQLNNPKAVRAVGAAVLLLSLVAINYRLRRPAPGSQLTGAAVARHLSSSRRIASQLAPTGQ